MLPVLLLLSCLVALSTGAPKNDVPYCPNILCAAVTCEDPKPTYLWFNGYRCRGCDFCPRLGRRSVAARPIRICPLPMCVDPGPCTVPYETTYFSYNGKKCPGCPVCPPGYGGYTLEES